MNRPKFFSSAESCGFQQKKKAEITPLFRIFFEKSYPALSFMAEYPRARATKFLRGIFADLSNKIVVARESFWELVTRAEPSKALAPATANAEVLTGVGARDGVGDTGIGVAVAESPAKREKKGWKEIARVNNLPSGFTVKGLYPKLCNADQIKKPRVVGRLATRLDGFGVQHHQCDLHNSHSCPFEARALLHHEKRVGVSETVRMHDHAWVSHFLT